MIIFNLSNFSNDTSAHSTNSLQFASPIYPHCSTTSPYHITIPRVFPWQIQSLVPQQWHQLDMPLGTMISIHRYDMIGMQNI